MAQPVAIVTGASTGIGFQTARKLAARGYLVIIATHNAVRGEAAAAAINREREREAAVGTGRAHFSHLDVGSFASVREFARRFSALYGDLHVLVLSAGVAGNAPGPRRSPDGFHSTMAINCLGHFLLLQLLLPLVIATSGKLPATAPCRVVFYSSVTHRLVDPPTSAARWGELFSRPGGQGYAYSKLAMMLFAYELQRRLAAEGAHNVAAVAVNPGGVDSDIWRSFSPACLCTTRPLRRLFFLDTEKGCATGVAAAADAEVAGTRIRAGVPLYLSPYYAPGWAQGSAAPGLFFDLLMPFAGPRPIASSPASYKQGAAAALWQAAEEAVARSPALSAL